MKSISRGATADLLLLSVAAGSADAAGYMGLGRVFTSNMTGNVVLLGIALGRGQVEDSVRALYVLVIFSFGVFLGAWVGRHIERQDWPRLAARIISWEALLLVVFALLWFVFPASQGPAAHGCLTLLALAMGLQSAATNRLSAPGVATTAITGTLTSLLTGSVQLFAARAPSSAASGAVGGRMLFQFAVLFLYGLGAVMSGLLMKEASRWIGFVPVAAVMAVVLRHVCAKGSREDGV